MAISSNAKTHLTPGKILGASRVFTAKTLFTGPAEVALPFAGPRDPRTRTHYFPDVIIPQREFVSGGRVELELTWDVATDERVVIFIPQVANGLHVEMSSETREALVIATGTHGVALSLDFAESVSQIEVSYESEVLANIIEIAQGQIWADYLKSEIELRVDEVLREAQKQGLKKRKHESILGLRGYDN